MDIFIVEIDKNEDKTLLKKFEKKEISDSEKWFEHCYSYMMTDKILEEFYNIENREIIFSAKKPILKSGEKHFSISHSGKFIVLAFSDNNCGIDIEEIKSRDFQKISKRMGFECETLEEFYRCWTKFEADYKLSVPAKLNKCFCVENYAITASSVNSKEEFNIIHSSDKVIR